jgi:hypothetical protein
VLGAIAALVLLISCANIASLLVARVVEDFGVHSTMCGLLQFRRRA